MEVCSHPPQRPIRPVRLVRSSVRPRPSVRPSCPALAIRPSVQPVRPSGLPLVILVVVYFSYCVLLALC